MNKYIQNQIIHAKRLSRLAALLIVAALCVAAQAQTTGEPHGWLGTETLKTRVGTFEFNNGYPTDDTAQRLLDLQTLNRATEVYLTQMMAVNLLAYREGSRAFGAKKPTQVIVWEQLTDAKTVMLTGNTETVYATTVLAPGVDGPTVVEAPPQMLGLMMDGLQRFLADIGPLGADKGKGGKYVILPPGFRGKVPDGYFVVRSPTNSVTMLLRGFQVNGKTDQAVALMRRLRIYPLEKASTPPAMEFMNASRQNINLVFPDNFRYFELLNMLVQEEPSEVFDPLERSMMRAIGIEKGKPFAPDARMKAILSEAARLGGAMARANAYATRPSRYYPDRQWETFPQDVDYTFMKDGAPLVDLRNYFYYVAWVNTPAVMEKNIGQGSQYLWTYRDASGKYFDGTKTYRMRIPANVPAKNFWSVVVYDSLSRSVLDNGQPFPSLSSYTKPVTNADGSVDIYFGPEAPQGKSNWIRTVPGKGWFAAFRFYSPSEPYFDKSWKLEDIVPLP
jgi:hypothetical protein